jgi:hypothetical protein
VLSGCPFMLSKVVEKKEMGILEAFDQRNCKLLLHQVLILRQRRQVYTNTQSGAGVNDIRSLDRASRVLPQA